MKARQLATEKAEEEKRLEMLQQHEAQMAEMRKREQQALAEAQRAAA